MGTARFQGGAIFPGPTRFREGWIGQAYLFPLSGGNSSNLIEVSGTMEATVMQTGRLVAGSEASLAGAVSTLRARAESSATGTLDSGGFRAWANMTMLRVRFDEFVDRGRQWSVGYAIDYARLA
jgi:hypothetical protein